MRAYMRKTRPVRGLFDLVNLHKRPPNAPVGTPFSPLFLPCAKARPSRARTRAHAYMLQKIHICTAFSPLFAAPFADSIGKFFALP